MDSKLRKALTECIRDIETGTRDVDGCLREHPDQAAELLPHLELWRDLDASSRADPSFGSLKRGEYRLLTALSEMDTREEKRMIPALVPAAAKVAAVVAGVVLLAGGAVGASAALGGPDVAHEVLSGIGISNASDTGKGHANPNAFDGADNAGQGFDNASDNAKDNANPNAFDGSDNTGPGNNNASDTGKEHANSGSLEGASQADDADGDGDDALNGDVHDDKDDKDKDKDKDKDDNEPQP